MNSRSSVQDFERGRLHEIAESSTVIVDPRAAAGQRDRFESAGQSDRGWALRGSIDDAGESIAPLRSGFSVVPSIGMVCRKRSRV